VSSLAVAFVALGLVGAPPQLSPEVLARAQQPAPALADDELEYSWLGIAGVRLRTRETTLLIDPYLTRQSLLELLLGRVRVDEPTLGELLPEADAIFIGHAHYDHVADAPAIARRTGAVIAGTRTTCHVARALGAERCRTLVHAMPTHVAPRVWATVFPATHGHLPGASLLGAGRELSVPPPASPHPLFDLPHGGPLLIVLDVTTPDGGHLTVAAHTTAGLDPPTDAALDGVKADLFFAAAAQAHLREDWPARISRALKPGGTLVLTHFEPLWGQLKDGATNAEPDGGDASVAVPSLAALVEELKATRDDIHVVVPIAFERVRVRAAERGRAASTTR
jgi:hypothetical protein